MAINFPAAKTSWDDQYFENFKKTVTRTPVTKVNSNTGGDETLTDGTPDTSYECIFFKRTDVWDQMFMGLFDNADAIVLIKTTQTLNKNDKITFGGEEYRVNDVKSRYLGETKMYQAAELFKNG